VKLCQGRVGKQEGANLIGIALVSSALFVLDIAEAYQYGNGTYVSFPGAILLALVLFLLLAGAMRASGQKDLLALMDFAFGKFVGNILSALICVLLFANAYFLISRFATMVHALVFMEVTLFPVLLWIVPVVIYIAFHGFECIARIAKCFGVILGACLLLSLLFPIDGYEAYRLFPLPLNHWDTIAADAFTGTFATIPAMLALLCMAQGMQGVQSAKKAGIIGAAVSIGLVAAVQVAIGMTFTYTELQNMFVPLYRLNLKLVQESYFFRLDKMLLFLWLIGALIAGAYYLYGAGFVFCRRWSRYDIRPAVIAAGIILLCCLTTEHMGQLQAFQVVRQYGSWLLVVPFTAAAAVALVKSHFLKKKGQTDEKA